MLSTHQIRDGGRWVLVRPGLLMSPIGVDPHVNGMNHDPGVGAVQFGVWPTGLTFVLVVDMQEVAW